MTTKELCSDACTFVIVAEKRYCASYECKDCGTHDVLWRNNPMQDLPSRYYKNMGEIIR